MTEKDKVTTHSDNRPSDEGGMARDSVVSYIDQGLRDSAANFHVIQTQDSVRIFDVQQTKVSTVSRGGQLTVDSASSSDLQQTQDLTSSSSVEKINDSAISSFIPQIQDSATKFGLQQTPDSASNFCAKQRRDSISSSRQTRDSSTSSDVRNTCDSTTNLTKLDVKQTRDSSTNFNVQKTLDSTTNFDVLQSHDSTTNFDVQQTRGSTTKFDVVQTHGSTTNLDVDQTRDSTTNFDVQQTCDSVTSSDYDTDLDENEETFHAKEREVHECSMRENAGSGHVTYTEICASLGITPIRRILDQFRLTEMRLVHVGMNGSDCKALACALWHNTTVEALDLEENGLCGEDLVPVINVLKNNIHITSLSLRDNIIDTVAAMALDDVLGEPDCQLIQLNLSGTHIGDKEVEYISAGIQNNISLEWLNLSHNNISINGAKKLGRAIGDTTTLHYLDLSWNHIRMGGAVALLKGLKINNSIISMSLGMNGLGYEGSLALEETLRENTCLKTFDVSNNRINWEGVSFVAKGLKKNSSLRMLQIGNNPINMEGCYELVKAVASPKCNVLHLGLDNIPVNGAVLVVAEQLLRSRKFSLTHGGILDTRDIVGIRKEKREDPLTLIVRYLAMTGIRMIDLFRMFDSDNDGMVSKEHFIRGLKRVGVPLPHNELVNVARRLDRGKKGSISYSILANGVRNHIREERKEDRRQEVRKRLKVEERRRILQTELPSIFKRSYNDDLSLYYATLSSFGSSPYNSTSNLDSTKNALVLPPIAPSDRMAAKDKKEMTSSENMTTNQGDLKKDSPKKLAFKEEVRKKPYKLLKYLNAYLDRRKTEARFDQSLLPKTD